MAKSTSNRIFAAPSAYARTHYLYVQEVGTLQSLEPHISKRQNLSSYLFFLVLDGSGYVSYMGKRHSISAGDCVWLDCGSPYYHESSAEEPWSLMWVHFYGNDAPEYYRNFLAHNCSFLFRPRTVPAFTDLLNHLYQTQQNKSSLMELKTHKYLTELVILCHTENGGSQERESSISEKLLQVHAYLEEHYSEKLSLDALSELFFISKYHLSREYKKRYGATLMNDLNARRISQAKALLRFTDRSVDSVSSACGFLDAGYFIKVFRKSENMTPLEYRKKW